MENRGFIGNIDPPEPLNNFSNFFDIIGLTQPVNYKVNVFNINTMVFDSRLDDYQRYNRLFLFEIFNIDYNGENKLIARVRQLFLNGYNDYPIFNVIINPRFANIVKSS